MSHWELLQVADNKQTPSRRTAAVLNALLVLGVPTKHKHAAIQIAPCLGSIIIHVTVVPNHKGGEGQRRKQSGGDDKV